MIGNRSGGAHREMLGAEPQGSSFVRSRHQAALAAAYGHAQTSFAVQPANVQAPFSPPVQMRRTGLGLSITKHHRPRPPCYLDRIQYQEIKHENGGRRSSESGGCHQTSTAQLDSDDIPANNFAQHHWSYVQLFQGVFFRRTHVAQRHSHAGFDDTLFEELIEIIITI